MQIIVRVAAAPNAECGSDLRRQRCAVLDQLGVVQNARVGAGMDLPIKVAEGIPHQSTARLPILALKGNARAGLAVQVFVRQCAGFGSAAVPAAVAGVPVVRLGVNQRVRAHPLKNTFAE